MAASTALCNNVLARNFPNGEPTISQSGVFGREPAYPHANAFSIPDVGMIAKDFISGIWSPFICARWACTKLANKGDNEWAIGSPATP
ncbi:MAG: Uncharacterised protein [Methanobacteriota archaeon]|nr:MAG: Uncharacterised protein [Euryarchaeota archaeon]